MEGGVQDIETKFMLQKWSVGEDREMRAKIDRKEDGKLSLLTKCK